MQPLQEVAPGTPITAEAWNQLVRELRRLQNITVAPPLSMLNQAGGVSIWVGSKIPQHLVDGHDSVNTSAPYTDDFITDICEERDGCGDIANIQIRTRTLTWDGLGHVEVGALSGWLAVSDC